jgi:hypothetical protein
MSSEKLSISSAFDVLKIETKMYNLVGSNPSLSRSNNLCPAYATILPFCISIPPICNLASDKIWKGSLGISEESPSLSLVYLQLLESTCTLIDPEVCVVNLVKRGKVQERLDKERLQYWI